MKKEVIRKMFDKHFWFSVIRNSRRNRFVDCSNNCCYEWKRNGSSFSFAFEIGSASIINGQNFTASSFDMHTEHAIKLLKLGRFRYRLSAIAKATNSGTMSWHNASLYTQQFGVLETRVSYVPYSAINVGDDIPWEFLYEDEGGHIAIDDVFCPMFVYPKNTSMLPSSVKLISYELNVALWQTIKVEYTPT